MYLGVHWVCVCYCVRVQHATGTSFTATGTAIASSRRRCAPSRKQVTATIWWRPSGWTCTQISWARDANDDRKPWQHDANPLQLIPRSSFLVLIPVLTQPRPQIWAWLIIFSIFGLICALLFCCCSTYFCCCSFFVFLFVPVTFYFCFCFLFFPLVTLD